MIADRLGVTFEGVLAMSYPFGKYMCFIDKQKVIWKQPFSHFHYNGGVMVPRTVKEVLRMLQRCYDNKMLDNIFLLG